MDELEQKEPSQEEKEEEDFVYESLIDKETVDKENIEPGKSETKNIVIILAVIIGIFVLSFGGLAIYNKITGGTVVNIEELHDKNLKGKLNDEEGYTYGAFSVVKADGLWWTEIMKDKKTLLKIPLHYGPKELENIPLAGRLNPAFNKGEDVFIGINPNVANKYYSLAVSELSFNLVKGMDRIPRGSCTMDDPICENRTIITCETANGRPVVELNFQDKAPTVEFFDTCVKISGQGEDIVKAVDRLLYFWYGIMLY